MQKKFNAMYFCRYMCVCKCCMFLHSCVAAFKMNLNLKKDITVVTAVLFHCRKVDGSKM